MLSITKNEILLHHTVTHTHTQTQGGGWSRLPGRLVSDWMSDARDSCTHHSFYEYITFYVHPNTNLSSSENQAGQASAHWSPGKLQLSETLRCGRQISTDKNHGKSFSWVVIRSSTLTEYMCGYLCVCSCVCGVYTAAFCLHFFFLKAEMVRKISKCVICLHENSPTSKTSSVSPKNPKNLQFFFTRAVSPVFHLSIAQKAKASNDTRRKMERLLPTKQGEKKKDHQPNRHILADDWHPCIFLLFLWCSSRRTVARNCGLTLWLMQQSGDMRLSACQPPGWKKHNQPLSQSLLAQPMV